MTVVWIVVVMCGVGVLFGLLLGFTTNKFSVATNPLIHAVDDVLPKGQCGACGFAGCMGYAEAVVNNPDVPVNLCIPGKNEVAEKIAELTGKKAAATEQRVAHIKCCGTLGKAKQVFAYHGINNCLSANQLQGGNKACKFGCLGMGSCVVECVFDALSMGSDGLPVVNAAKCTGCGKCLLACPKKIIDMIPATAHVRVDCSSKDKGAVTKSKCSAGCIGCKLCEKNCPHGGVKVIDNVAIVDSKICIEVCTDAVCVKKCPTKVLITLVSIPAKSDK